MDKMLQRSTSASCPTSTVLPQDEFVVRRLDQLEDLGKYSVIYEIARIDMVVRLRKKR